MPHSLAGRWTWLAFACAISASQAAHANAQSPGSEAQAAAPNEPARIVLVASPGMEELVVRFMAELASLRLTVMRAPDVESAPSVPELEQLARQHAARVAVRVSRSGAAVDLWLVNASSHELVHRRVVAEGDAAVLVLRSLEILRGALIDLRAVDEEPPPPVVAPPPAPPVVPPAEPARAPPLWLGLSPAAVAPHAGRNLGVGATLALRRSIEPRFALHAELLTPFEAWSVDGTGGTAQVWVGAATLAGIVMPWGDKAIAPGIGVGIGALALHTRGEAAAGYRGSSGLNAAFFPHGRLEVALGLRSWLRLRGALAAGVATPRPVLLFAGERNESWLNPLLLSSLGVEIALR